jgi:two-component system response regulator FixJ
VRPTVYVVDDDPGVRESLRMLLEQAGLLVETYPDGQSFLAVCTPESSGCVLLDLAMPGMDGQAVQAALIASAIELPVLFLTGCGDIPTAVDAVQAGALDFLEKPIRSEVLLDRVQSALASDAERRDEARRLQDLRRRYERLSPREREVMALLTSGLSNKEIARKLDLSPRTVETHRAHVMHKMGVGNTAELIAVALQCID